MPRNLVSQSCRRLERISRCRENCVRSHLKLGKIFGIRIGLHFSWLLIAALIVVSLSNQFRSSHHEWTSGTVLALSLLTALLFFTSLLLHELSHSLVAKAHAIPVKEITLFALGGVSQIEGETASAKIEFWMALAGPLASVAIGALSLALAHALGAFAAAAMMFSWLGYINLALAGFNLIPGYPLDGGRILRALVWWKSGNADAATRIAARTGQVVAVLFIMAGLADYLAGGGFNGLWITFIGWFLLQAASESRAEVGVRRSLESVRVADVMSHDYPVVDGHLNLQHFVEDELLRTGRRCFVVMDDGSLAGLVTPHEIRRVERRTWPFTTLDDVMLPAKEIRTLRPEESLQNALALMGNEDVNQLPVVANGKLQGILSRGDIVSYLQTRAEIET